MEELQDDLKIYSEEVRDVLSLPPKAIYKWGSTILLFFILLLGTLSWFIKYPDVIVAEIIITTNTPPEKLIARTSGKIEKILIENRIIVLENTPLAIIENSAEYKDVFLLKSIVDKTDISNKEIIFPFEELNSSNLGEIEESFVIFEKDYIVYELNKNLQPYQVEGTAQNLEAVELKERLSLLIQQKEISEKELEFKKKELAL